MRHCFFVFTRRRLHDQNSSFSDANSSHNPLDILIVDVTSTNNICIFLADKEGPRRIMHLIGIASYRQQFATRLGVKMQITND